MKKCNILFKRGIQYIIRLFYDFVSFFQSNKVFIAAYVQCQGNDVIHSNWGDDINKFFIESISDLNVKILGISYIHKHLPVFKYSCIGSILGTYPGNRWIVWGSGCISENDVLRRTPERICSVRGPLSRNLLLNQGIECPPVYGDPALLISRYYRPQVSVQYEIGIIPHYLDMDNPLIEEIQKLLPQVLIIKMKGYGHWHDIPDQICSCKRIASSSLHGLIVADSYGIPNVWIRLSDKVKGGSFKYLDYFGSVGRKESHPLDIFTIEDFVNLIKNGKFSIAPFIDFNAIKDACPFNSHLKDFQYNDNFHG